MFAYILLALCAFLLCQFRKRRDYWKNRNVPYARGSLILGNSGFSPLKFNAASKIYGDIYNRFKGFKYCGMINFGKPALLILDPDLIGDVLVKNFASFQDNMIEINGKDKPLLSKYLFFGKGEAWKKMRHQLLEHFTAGKVKNLFPLIAEGCGDLQHFLENQVNAAQNIGLNAFELGTNFTTDIVTSCIFSVDRKSLADRSSEFMKMMGNAIDTSLFNRILFSIESVLPIIRKVKAPSLHPLEFIEWFKSFVLDEVEVREREQVQRGDFLDAVREMKTKTTEFEFTVDHVVGYCLAFLMDGIGTSTVALHYALYEVGANPDVQEKLQRECDGVLAQNGGNLTHDVLKQMPYLDMVVMESIRKHPPLMFMARKCTRATKLPPAINGGGEIMIEEGQGVIIPIHAIHYDHQYYPEPNKFDPHRFAEEAKRSRPKYSFLGFGGGPRICLGQRYGFVMIKAAIVTIVSKFNVRINEKTVTPLEPDLDEYENVPKGGIWLNFYKRKGDC